ncbi:MAG: amino acid ABC transporter substrate-binding protein [Chloroflexi bacterium]|nr:MAG: amino acid ABC transporter substrate-binding protein [Chloroflexota bacterium]
MIFQVDRRTFLKHATQASGLVATGATLQALLAACSLDISNPDTTGPAATAATGSSSTPQKIEAKGLKTAGLLQWGSSSNGGAPYVFPDPDAATPTPTQLVGFELEIANAIATAMGIKAKQVETDHGQLTDALQTNNFDAIMNGWEATDERRSTELFSQPYYRSGQQIVVRSNDTRFAGKTAQDTLTLKVLEGHTIGASLGSKAAVMLGQNPKITLKTYDSDILFNDLVTGTLDAMLIDFPLATYNILGIGPASTKEAKLKLIGQPLGTSDYVLAYNKSSANAAVLQKEVDLAIAQIKNDGTLHEILDRWGLWNTQQAGIGTK